MSSQFDSLPPQTRLDFEELVRIEIDCASKFLNPPTTPGRSPADAGFLPFGA